MAFYILLVAVALVQLTGFSVAQQQQFGCNGKFNWTAEAGTKLVLSSDNYNSTGMSTYLPYTFCQHKIRAPAGKNLKMRFLDFELESTTFCDADYFNVFDLGRAGSEAQLDATQVCRARSNPRPVIGPICGNHSLEEYTTRAEVAVIEFCADYALEFRGWRVEIEVVDRPPVVYPPPCGTTVTLDRPGSPQMIQSPGFPNTTYQNNQNCTWRINTNPQYPLRLDAVFFDVGAPCADKVTIFDVTNNRFIGNADCFRFDQTPSITITNTSEVEIRFTSDDWDVHRGFEIELSLILCAPGYQACDDNNGCVHPRNQCDGVRHCADGSDELIDYCAPECGKSHFPIRDQPMRIVGGVEANRYSIPWQVAMLRRGGGQFCGGTVISDRWILTAAHCFTGGPGSAPQFVGRVGGHDLSLTAEEDLANDMEFETVLCHPYYSTRPSTDQDFCLIKTKEKIVFRKNIVPACLPRQGDDPEHGTPCLVSGWGDTGRRSVEDGFDTVEPVERAVNRAGDPLRHVISPIANRTYCSTAYPGSITTNMICAGNEQGGVDSCQGDSGGPFMCKNRYNRYQVSGVVSWGRGCALPNYPGVYARTGAAISWIINTITTN